MVVYKDDPLKMWEYDLADAYRQDDGYDGCRDPINKPLNKALSSCIPVTEDPKNDPDSCPKTSKPITGANGNKHFDFTDFAMAGESPLHFERHYNSARAYNQASWFGGGGITNSPLGSNWTHNYYYGLRVLPDEVKIIRNDGRAFSYYPNTTTGGWVGDADIKYRLFENTDQTSGARTGWKVITPENTVEIYSPTGDLLSITDRFGRTQILTYSQCQAGGTRCPSATYPDTPFDGLLWKITDNFGREIKLSYSDNLKLVKLTAPTGKEYVYGYDSQANNLKTVTYPDNTPANSIDNPKTTYIYGEDSGESSNICTASNPQCPAPNTGISYTHSLTGVIDENGVRYLTYQYDADGRAIKEYTMATPSQVRNVDQYNLTYLTDDPDTAGVIDPVTTITDPLGSDRSTHFTTVLGVLKPTGSNQPAGSGCLSASSNIKYDAKGNVSSLTDFNKHKTCYRYDLARNLETKQVEGLNFDDDCTASLNATSFPVGGSIRASSTQWHPNWHLASIRIEPLKITSYVYNGRPDPSNGNAVLYCAPSVAKVDNKPIAVLCKRIEQATTDKTGAIANPTVTGTPRVWNYQYNQVGQMLTEDGPRTDVDDFTNYSYYDGSTADHIKGDLQNITNPLGQITTYNSYTPSGQPTKITAPNGVVTELDYFPRGWLKTLNVKDRNGVNAELTQYTYTPTGLLETVILPDGSKLKYSYDDAHRLTDIAERIMVSGVEADGNKVHYALDAMGNRKEEEFRDSSDALKRNISRVYDALNRLQTVTGAEQ